ncbi:MAG: response regulator [Cyanobacteria bacterium J06642_2]
MNQRILIIEDELQIRQSMVDFLTLEGYEVFDTDNGHEAIEIAKKHRPNLILSDINMPHLDGYNVLSTLQQNPKLADIPFIFLTARVDQRDCRLGMEMGADDYITKPFTFEELMQAIKTRLRKRASTASFYCQEIQKLYGLALQTC